MKLLKLKIYTGILLYDIFNLICIIVFNLQSEEIIPILSFITPDILIILFFSLGFLSMISFVSNFYLIIMKKINYSNLEFTFQIVIFFINLLPYLLTIALFCDYIKPNPTFDSF